MYKWPDKISPLARKLVGYSVAFSTLVAILATAMQLYVDYRMELGEIEKTFGQIEQSFVPTISNALWATNHEEVEIAISGLVKLPDICYVEITENNSIWMSTGTKTPNNIRTRYFSLIRVHRGESITIGNLNVMVDMAGVYKRILNKLWVILISNSAKTFLVAGFMLWLFRWLVTRHLQRIAHFSANLSTDNLDTHLTLDRQKNTPAKQDEFDQVVDGFGRMQSKLFMAIQTLEQDLFKLEQAEDKISNLNAELEQRVVERTSQLEAVNRELEAFSYSVSHDLRTPLRSIDGFSQALEEDYGNRLDDIGLDYLSRVRRAAQRMGLLIDDLLRLARITRADMKKIQIDLSAMVHELISDLIKYRAIDENSFVVQEGLVAYGDPTLLRIVMENLLDNAAKYSSKIDHPRIEIGSMLENNRSVYFVRDNGAGFDMAFVSKLFGAFQRLHRADEFPGTGVGLATVKRIIHRHGGEVWAEGETGKGALFRFTLAI